MNGFNTHPQSATATVCDNMQLFGAAPERDEFDSRDIWDREDAIPALREAIRILAQGVAPDGTQLADERESLMWGFVNMLHAQTQRLDRAVDRLVPANKGPHHIGQGLGGDGGFAFRDYIARLVSPSLRDEPRQRCTGLLLRRKSPKLLNQLDRVVEGDTSAWMHRRVVTKPGHAEVRLIVEWLASCDTDAESKIRRERHKNAVTQGPSGEGSRVAAGMSWLDRE